MEDKFYIIGIAGGSGSGKTTFVKKLRERFSTNQMCILSLDNYYIPREDQAVDKKGVRNFDLPQSIDANLLYDDLQKIKNGQSITKTEYVFNNEEAIAKDFSIDSAPIIIIEGLFIYHYTQIANLFDLKLFIYAKDNIKLIRRIKRDRSERNYPLEDVIYRYEHHVMPSFEKYINVYRDDCDIIINNNSSFQTGLEVLTAFIKDKLNKLSD